MRYGRLSTLARIGALVATLHHGGTYALDQQSSAMSLMFERTQVVDDVGIAVRYLARVSLVGKLGQVASGSGRNDADLITFGLGFKTS